MVELFTPHRLVESIPVFACTELVLAYNHESNRGLFMEADGLVAFSEQQPGLVIFSKFLGAPLPSLLPGHSVPQQLSWLSSAIMSQHSMMGMGLGPQY